MKEYLNVPYIKSLYKQFNDQYFDGKLGTYPIIIKRNKKRVAGVISLGIPRRTETYEIQRIEFSNILQITEVELWGVLLHEMIHVKLIEDKTVEIGGSHGFFFQNEVKRLQKDVGFTIPTTTFDITRVRVNEYISDKEYLVLFLHDAVIVFNPKNKIDVQETLLRFPLKWLELYKPILFLSQNPIWMKYPLKRKLVIKNQPTYIIDQVDKDDLFKNGIVFFKYEKALVENKFTSFKSFINI